MFPVGSENTNALWEANHRMPGVIANPCAL